MNPISLYTKKLELKLDDNAVSLTDLEDLINEISKDYIILDYSPSITIQDKFQYITFKVTQKQEPKTMGFDFGKK